MESDSMPPHHLPAHAPGPTVPDRSEPESFARWSREQPAPVVARLLESKITRIAALQEQLGDEQRQRKQLVALLVGQLRTDHPDGLVVSGIFYRLHADGRGLDRTRIPIPEVGRHDS